MRITGYRTVTTLQDWGRPVGDVNGFIRDGITEVPVVVLETDEGLEGIGVGSHTDIDRVFPAIEGEDPRAVVALYDRMLARVFKSGHVGATFGGIGALDMALWDLKAKIADEPLWRTLGARDRFVPAYASALEIAIPDDELEDLYGEWLARGFTSVKVKGGLNLDSDLVRLARVRDIFSANTARPGIMLDANESWNRKQAIRYIHAVEEQVDLSWVEEPLRRWDADGMAMVSRAVRAGVATGENLTGLEQFKPLLDAGAVDIVQVGSMWGITHFLVSRPSRTAVTCPSAPSARLRTPSSMPLRLSRTTSRRSGGPGSPARHDGGLRDRLRRHRARGQAGTWHDDRRDAHRSGGAAGRVVGPEGRAARAPRPRRLATRARVAIRTTLVRAVDERRRLAHVPPARPGGRRGPRAVCGLARSGSPTWPHRHRTAGESLAHGLLNGRRSASRSSADHGDARRHHRGRGRRTC